MDKSQRIRLIRIIAAAVICVAGFFIPVTGVAKIILFAIPYLIVGYDIILEAIENILHGELFDEEFLMTIATVGAFAVGEYPEAAGVMIFFQIGELFEEIAVGNSKKSISELMNIRPDYAVVVREEKEIRVSPEEVSIGEIIIIKPGEKVPLDGVIVDGTTSVNTAALTGESLPASKSVGDKIISGSININGVIRVKTESVFAESTVSKILELVENSSEKKAKKHVRTPEEERIHLENLSEIRIKRREKKQQQQKVVDRAIAKLKKSGWCPPKARPSVPIDTKRYVLKQFTIQPTDDNSFERTVCREVAVTLNPQALRKYAKTEHERLLELNKNKLGYYGISIEPAESATGEKLKLIDIHWRKKFAA